MKAPRWLADEDELDREPAAPSPEAESAPVPRRWLAGLVAGAAAARLGYLFFFNTPENAGGNSTDAYHHWQIAYLTR